VVLEPDLGLDHLSCASLLIPLKLVLSGCKSFVSFYSVKKLTQLIVGSTEDAKDRVLVVVCFLLGNYPASGVYMPTFRNTLVCSIFIGR